MKAGGYPYHIERAHVQMHAFGVRVGRQRRVSKRADQLDPTRVLTHQHTRQRHTARKRVCVCE
jgi:hypothetical protein